MTNKKGYTEDDLREVADNPEWTEHDLATAQPMDVLLPDLASSIRREKKPQKPSADA